MPLSFNWTLNVITGTFTNAPAPTSVDIAPRDFALDATGDLQVLNGDLVMNYGTAKRLSQAFNKLIARYEQQYGEIPTNGPAKK